MALIEIRGTTKSSKVTDVGQCGGSILNKARYYDTRRVYVQEIENPGKKTSNSQGNCALEMQLRAPKLVYYN
jgi:hypothetical protein